MDANRLARLTDQQRTCLRLVYAGLSSKVIAQRLGIEPGSVDQHLKAAMRVLGVSGRHTAARLLAEAERSSLPELAYHSRTIAGFDDVCLVGPSTGDEQQQRRSPGMFVNEEQAPFRAFTPPAGAGLPLPIKGAKPHHLSVLQRLGWIVAAAIGIALAFGALASAIDALVRLTTR